MASFDLDGPGGFTSLADLVGVSRQAIHKLQTKNENPVFPENGTLGEWLVIYVDRLRTEASGRSGDSNESLTGWRKEEAKENALSKRLDRLEKEQALISRAAAAEALQRWALTVRASVEHAENNAAERIESRHGITLDDSDLGEHLRAAISDIASAAEQLATGFVGSGPGDGSENIKAVG